MTAHDPRAIINQRPMSRFQVLAVAITIGLNALDGFDVLAITFASPGISSDWGVQRAALGVVISTGLIGMALGSLVIAPLADTFGRRPMILGCLFAMAVGMLLSATANDIYMLSAWRVLTGLGIGGMLASINAMAAEYSNDRRRDLCVSLMAVGYPIGGVLGGALAAQLLKFYDWRSVFVLGGVISALFLPLVWWRLPESIAFLIHKRPVDALKRINAILGRMGHPVAAEMPPPPPAREKGSLADIFRPGLAGTTIAVTASYFMHIMAFYYVLSWLPKLVADMGFSASDATTVSVWANLGGAAGGMVLGLLAFRLGLKPITIAVMVLSTFLIGLFGMTVADLTLLKLVAAATMFFANAGVVGLYAVMAQAFPTHVRATGTGFVIGVGRGGGALAPIISGLLFGAGLGRADVSMIMGAAALFAAFALAMLPLARPVRLRV